MVIVNAEPSSSSGAQAANAAAGSASNLALVAMVKEELNQLHEKGHMGEAFREDIKGRVEEQLVALIGERDEGLRQGLMG